MKSFQAWYSNDVAPTLSCYLSQQCTLKGGQGGLKGLIEHLHGGILFQHALQGASCTWQCTWRPPLSGAHTDNSSVSFSQSPSAPEPQCSNPRGVRPHSRGMWDPLWHWTAPLSSIGSLKRSNVTPRCSGGKMASSSTITHCTRRIPPHGGLSLLINKLSIINDVPASTISIGDQVANFVCPTFQVSCCRPADGKQPADAHPRGAWWFWDLQLHSEERLLWLLPTQYK